MKGEYESSEVGYPQHKHAGNVHPKFSIDSAVILHPRKLWKQESTVS